MSQGDITVWTDWIREETVMNQLDEELEARGDPEDPFNSSANEVDLYQPLPMNLSLPPPVQTPRRQDVSEHREHSQNSLRRERKVWRVTNTNPNPQKVEPKNQMQAVRCKSEEDSLELLDPMSCSSNRANPRTQNHQGGVVPESEESTPVQDDN